MRGTIPTQVLLADPLIGQRLGEYEVIEAVGEGGMGVVYRGVQPIIKKRVAIKVLKPNMAGDATQVRRLADEAVAVNSIRHRSIIDIFSFGQLPDGRPYIVMEFLEGQPLDAYLHASGRISLGEAISLLIAMCAPLGAAHRAGVVHRALKPSNIFLCLSADSERYLKLLDFGLAKKGLKLDGSMEQTSRVQVTGTPNYMAPEQARGDAVSARTDLYALGVIAYELVTGELPYSAPAPMEVLMLHVSADIPSARALVPQCPPELDALITRMLNKAPEDRPQSAEEVRGELIAIARSLGTSPSYEAIDPVSGEYARPLGGSSDAMKPYSPMTLELQPTFVSQKSLREPRWPWVLGIGAGLLLAIACLAFLAIPNPPAEKAKEVAVAVAPPPPKVEPPPVVAPPPVEVTPDAPPKVDPPPEVVKTDPPPVIAKADPPPVKPRKGVPTADELKKKVASLETALNRATPAGEDPDPSAITLLRKYKVEATMLDTEADRQSLAESLKAFEQTFLKR